MRVWRLARERHAALDGEGARLFGARWSSEGIPLAYTASHLSLAALEYLVRIEVEDVPDDLIALEVEIPDDFQESVVTVRDLPPDWQATPAPPACAGIGDAWVSEGRTPLLRIPSVLVPEETNVLINPAHPRVREVRVVRVRPFSYDPRLLRRA
jgi:RES domain-containing protein